jgi:hypothetical protein
MDIRLGVIAKDRAFSKAVRRARALVEPVIASLAKVRLECPLWSAILVAITDDELPGSFREVPNSEGYYQVTAGCSWPQGDAELAQEILLVLRRTVTECGFALADCDALLKAFESS